MEKVKEVVDRRPVHETLSGKSNLSKAEKGPLTARSAGDDGSN